MLLCRYSSVASRDDVMTLFQIKLVNISSNDVVDGNPKLILGLVWAIILHWQVNVHVHQRSIVTVTSSLGLCHSTLPKMWIAN